MFAADAARCITRSDIRLDRGLVARYTMDNISGNSLVDEMGTYDGVIYDSPVFEPGVIGNCVSFINNPGYLYDFGMAGQLFDAISFFLFIPDKQYQSKVDMIGNLSTHAGVLAVGQPTTLLPRETFLAFSVFPEGSTNAFKYYYCKGDVEPGWHHVVIQWEQDRYVFHLDNTRLFSTWYSSGAGFPERLLDLEYFALGMRPLGLAKARCKVDEVWIYDRGGEGLSAGEIDALYKEGASSITPHVGG